MISAQVDLVGPTEEELRARYDEYCERQSSRLVFLLPQEAVRPLYRRALRELGRADDRYAEDPLSALVAYCGVLLQLPPFEVWLEDVRLHPEAYLDELDHSPESPTVSAPATLEARRFARGGDNWVARLRGFRDRDAWRGFIAFERAGSDRVHRTALIFREQGPVDLRERFLGFESATLESFLRSALP